MLQKQSRESVAFLWVSPLLISEVKHPSGNYLMLLVWLKKKKWCCFTGRSGCWEFFTRLRNRNAARYVNVVCYKINYSPDDPDGNSIFTFDGLQIQIISGSTKSLKVYFAPQVPLKQTHKHTHNRRAASLIQSNGFARNFLFIFFRARKTPRM